MNKTAETIEDAERRHDQNQYLTFVLGRETFALGILSIKEILEYSPPTEIPMMPAFIRGVVNLRGAAVPVVDLCARFGRPSAAVTKKTCIVIVETRVEDESHVIGVVVDAVNEVLEIPGSEIEPAPSFGASIRADFIEGMGKVRGKFVMILDVDRVLCVEEMEMLTQAAASADVVQPAA
ncbi:chemotaxis protein CheW [Steroidobacter agaridevorans]|uniref:Chemotaxis protein CheW n=1 Tax=Steroidobacter agaridevorans TaxID=2695856 RepID=A0A829YKH5_9GAMM|nr:chemotaxis protein CheW [Steroidobacter agaridevorans]GFE83351.1 chemotaxis protein CheW [Steroidobacter agaridevorans]GFE86753.1 chemotaxis protein CheW [Steroidobacter agaridevorans]